MSGRQTIDVPRGVNAGGVAAPLAVVCSTFLWGTMWIPLRALDVAGENNGWLVTAAYVLPLVVLAPVGLARRRHLRVAGPALYAGGFLMAAAIALYSEGLLRGTVARVLLLFYLTPVWSTLLARVMLAEPVTIRRLATIVLGLAGMFVVFGGGSEVPLPRGVAEWMGLASGLCWGLSLIYLRRCGASADTDGVLVLFLFLAVLMPACVLMPGGRSSSIPGLSGLSGALPWVLLLGGLWLPAVVWLTMYGGGRLDPGRVAILLMLEIVVGIVSAVLLTDEPFGPRELIGALLIIVAGGVEVVPARFSAPTSAGAAWRRE